MLRPPRGRSFTQRCIRQGAGSVRAGPERDRPDVPERSAGWVGGRGQRGVQGVRRGPSPAVPGAVPAPIPRPDQRRYLPVVPKHSHGQRSMEHPGGPVRRSAAHPEQVGFSMNDMTLPQARPAVVHHRLVERAEAAATASATAVRMISLLMTAAPSAPRAAGRRDRGPRPSR
jgi:hypothetical protein